MPAIVSGDRENEFTEDTLLQQGIKAYEDEDYGTAFQILKPLADQGDAEAQWRLGDLYLGKGDIPRDELMALNYYLLSAEAGNSVGQYKWALFSDYRRAKYGDESDNEQIFEFYLLSARQGNPNAQEALAHVYYRGLLGVERDYIVPSSARAGTPPGSR